MMKAKSMLLLAGVTFFAAGVCADVFPTAGGDISIVGEGGWPTAIPEIAELSKAGTYTASQNVSFNRLNLGNGAKKTIIDLSGANRTITITDTTQYAVQFSILSAADVLFKGGHWNLSNEKGRLEIGSGKSYHDNKLTMDGCTFNQKGLFHVGHDNGYGCSIVLTNGATVAVDGYAAVIGNLGGHDNYLEVNAGCSVTSADFKTDVGGTSREGDSTRLLVRGTGALIDAGATGTAFFGNGHDNNDATFASGATLNCKNLRMGGGIADSSVPFCSNNTLRFLNGAKTGAAFANCYLGEVSSDNFLLVSNATFKPSNNLRLGRSAGSANNAVTVVGSAAECETTYLYLGEESGSSDNRVFVGDGAKAAGHTVRVGVSGIRNEFVVSNATFASEVFTLGVNEESVSNVLRVCGGDSTFTVKYFGKDNSGIFGPGGFGLIEFSDGFSYADSKGRTREYGNLSSNNVLRVTDGAVWNTGSEVQCFGQTATEGAEGFGGFRLEVGDRASYTVYALKFQSHDGALVVSNGTLTANSWDTDNDTVAVMLGCLDEGAGELPTDVYGNCLRFEGEAPKFRTGNNAKTGIRLMNSSRLEFQLPVSAYVEPPIDCKRLRMDETCEIVIDTSVLDAVEHEKVVYKLASLHGTNPADYIPESVLQATRAKLPAKATLAWVGSDLVLTMPGNIQHGMLLLFR